MGTTTVITSSAVTQLEADVTELTAKLNGVITEYNKVQADMSLNKLAIDDIKLKITNHKGKIDTLITDVTDHKSKIDTLITDMTGIKNKITSGYTASQTTGGGSASDAILERLSDLDGDYKVLSEHYNGHLTSHPTGSGSGRSGSRTGGGTIGAPTDRYIDITAASTASGTVASGASSGTADESSAATRDDSGLTDEHDIITPSYSTGTTKVITIGAKGEVRGKRLARQTLNRLRK